MFKRLGIPLSAYYIILEVLLMLKLVVMFRDECGDDRRAYGEFSGQVFQCPRFDENNKHMLNVFEMWKVS